MRRFVAVVPASIAATLLMAAPAAAQPQAGAVFISATAVAVIDEAPGADSALFGAPADGRSTVAGGAIGLGVHLTPRVSVRAEVQLAGRATTESDLPQILGVGLPFTLTQRFRATRSSTPVFALLAYHLPAGRLSVEVTGGLGLVRQTVTSRYESSISAPGLGGIFLPEPTLSEVTTSGYHAVAVVGADFAVAATPHLAVVPQVRAYVLGSSLSLRPGLGLRWTF